MKRLSTLLLTLVTLLSVSCKRDYEEFYFKGHIIDAKECSSTQIGYLMVIDKPEGVGDTITYRGKLYENAVMAYQASRRLKADETIYGVAYFYKNFATYNCVGLYYYTLPEISLISVDEAPSVIE